MSTIIKLRCIDQVLTFDSTPLIASGGVEEDRVQVEFCPKWDGLVKTAVFWRNEKEAFHVLLDDDDSAAIPPEVLIDEGRIYLGFFGVSAEEKQRTSQVLAYNVVKGAITLDSAPDSPTVDIYTQLLAKYLEMVDLAANMKTDQETFEQEMTQKQEQDQADFEQEIRDMIAAGLLPDDSVATEKIKNGAITAEKLAEGVAFTQAETLAEATKTLYGLGAGAVPDDVLKLLKTLVDSNTSGLSTRPQIETGSYTGAGSGTVTLTFGITPKIVFISMNGVVGSKNAEYQMFATYGQTKAVHRREVSSANYVSTINWDENILTVSHSDAAMSMDRSGALFYYTAIG